MRKISIIAIIVALIAVAPSGAFAFWTHGFNVHDTDTFDQVGIWWVAGDKFVSPAIRNLSAAGWATYDPSNTNAYIYGSALVDLDFDVAFEDPQSNGADFLMMAALNGNVKPVNRFRLAYDGNVAGNWTVSDSIPIGNWYDLGGGDPIDPATIPEPATMLLFGIGALGMGIIRKKKF